MDPFQVEETFSMLFLYARMEVPFFQMLPRFGRSVDFWEVLRLRSR
jgi:hypothetical protein